MQFAKVVQPFSKPFPDGDQVFNINQIGEFTDEDITLLLSYGFISLDPQEIAAGIQFGVQKCRYDAQHLQIGAYEEAVEEKE